MPSQREGVPSNRLKHSRNELPPLGEGWGGASIHNPNLPQGEGVKAKPHKTQQEWTPAPWEGTEKLKTTIKLKVDDGEIAVLPFIICLF